MIRIASLPADFEEFIRSAENTDEFVIDGINQGWPLRFATALTEAVRDFLIKIKAPQIRQKAPKQNPYTTDTTQSLLGLGIQICDKMVESILVDTGAQATVMRPEAKDLMHDPRPSTTVIKSANTTHKEFRFLKSKSKKELTADMISQSCADIVKQHFPNDSDFDFYNINQL